MLEQTRAVGLPSGPFGPGSQIAPERRFCNVKNLKTVTGGCFFASWSWKVAGASLAGQLSGPASEYLPQFGVVHSRYSQGLFHVFVTQDDGGVPVAVQLFDCHNLGQSVPGLQKGKYKIENSAKRSRGEKVKLGVDSHQKCCTRGFRVRRLAETSGPGRGAAASREQSASWPSAPRFVVGNPAERWAKTRLPLQSRHSHLKTKKCARSVSKLWHTVQEVSKGSKKNSDMKISERKK